MTRESSLWNWLKKGAKLLRDELHICRVENSTMKGMPDVEGKYKHGEQFWTELKSAERPARSTTPIRFKVREREAQIEWLTKRYELGGHTYLLLQVGSGPERAIYLISGRFSAAVYRGLTEDHLQDLSCCNPKEKAQDIIKIMSYSQN